MVSAVKQKEFSQSEKIKIVEKLITARIGLLLRHSFIGNMATRLVLVDASDWCATLAVDGRRLYYNNSFVDQLSPKELEFGFGHEILHLLFDHLGRRNNRDALLANIAADYASNQILKDERIGEVPRCIKIYQDNQYRGKSFEEIYEILYQNAKVIDVASLGELLDDHLDGNGDQDGRPKLTEEEKKQIRDEIKEAMVAAAQGSAGNIPAAVRQLIQGITEPKMNWRQLLRMNIQSIIRSNFSFSRPNRKSQHSGAILPGMLFDETIHVSIGIDASGSISQHMIKDFVSEIKGIMDEYSDFIVDIWCFDTEVYNHKQYTAENAQDLLEYEIKGGGGTDFMCNWNYMKHNDIVPKKFIMFTDGEPFGSWGEEDYCDSLFVVHGSNSIVSPFGQTAYYTTN
jgi:predicted metal-dependent peptidase